MSFISVCRLSHENNIEKKTEIPFLLNKIKTAMAYKDQKCVYSLPLNCSNPILSGIVYIPKQPTTILIFFVRRFFDDYKFRYFV